MGVTEDTQIIDLNADRDAKLIVISEQEVVDDDALMFDFPLLPPKLESLTRTWNIRSVRERQLRLGWLVMEVGSPIRVADVNSVLL